jgi:ribonuclease J
MDLLKPKYLLPIGGNFRHMIAYQKLAESRGFNKDQVILADDGQVVEFFASGGFKIFQGIETKQIMVDALGIGDVGNVVLRDRKILSEEGIVVIVVPIDQIRHLPIGDPEVITRGFIYIKENLAFLKQTKEKIRQIIKETKGKRIDYHFIRRRIQEGMEEFFFKTTGRRPMVLPVIIEV